MTTEHRFSGVLSTDYNLVKLMIPHYDEHEATVQEAIRSYVSGKPREKYLAFDLGCGTGLLTQQILEADPRIEVHGIDNEPAMIDQAKQFLTPWGIGHGQRVTLSGVDALTALNAWSSWTVDIIATGNMLHNLEPGQRRLIMQAAARVLAPGGLFVNADKLGLDDAGEHRRQLAAQLENLYAFDEIGRADLRHLWHAHYLEDEKINFTEGEQKALLEEFGFERIQTVYRNRLEATVIALKIKR